MIALKTGHQQQGYFLIMAVIFILVIGVMGTLIAYLFANRAGLSVSQLNGLRTFYMAESGLEIGTRLLTTPNLSGRLACGAVTGTSAVTNASIGNGTFTLTTINSSPVFAASTLSTSETSTDTTINLSSTASFAPSGRVMVDQEAIDYAAISGSALVGVTRGVNGTIAVSHASGTRVGQYQCSLNASAGIPTIASPSYQRALQRAVQLQYGWTVGNASGSNFTLSAWNESTEISWNVLSLVGGSSAANLNSVSMISLVDGWAVGNQASGNFILLRWNGSNWTLNTVAGSCNNQHLLGVSMVSSQQAFAVGTRYIPGCSGGGNFRYTVMQWNGSSWSLLTPTTVPADSSLNRTLNAVYVIDSNGDGMADVGFAVGDNGTILRYNSTAWVAATSPVSQSLRGVFMVSATEAWAVGAGGVILRWNGSSWSLVSSPTTTGLNAVSMLDTDGNGSADLGFAVGDSGEIVTYNGSSWSNSVFGSNNFFGVSIVNTKEAWAVGGSGVAYHWDGSTWTSVNSGTTRALNSVSMIPSGTQPNSAWQQDFR